MEPTSTGKTTSGKELGPGDLWDLYFVTPTNGLTERTLMMNQGWHIWTMPQLPWGCSCSCSRTDQTSTIDGALELLKNSAQAYENLLPIVDEMLEDVNDLYGSVADIVESLTYLISEIDRHKDME